jgi:hypothetical protein
VSDARPAGYSSTPLVEKLGIKRDARLALIGAPADFARILGDLPAGVTVLQRATKSLDVIVAFCVRRVELQRRLARLKSALQPAGGLWIAWPKRASGVPTELTEGTIRELGLSAGLVDNKVCAIDATWSGLRFVIRVRDRPTR